ncbi:hypothetical protein [Streptomyces vietnamensis]|uniref:Uncharacterized protein n=1 Tax=Streptomyces vietnamensis TaxID=362257 RepID=A0A0B5IHC6_9ACTN|nr:hypothetical protein [Streptomyces vietnamensis]AJF67734.1 hypothetical protein SVTN_28420 [Streptomyces vietnamensis]
MTIWRSREASGGMQITGNGNQVNTGQIGGDQRQSYVSTGQDTSRLQAALAKLSELEAAMEEHAVELSNVDLARRTAGRIGEELNSARPDERRIRDNLEDLGLAIGSAAAVVTVLQGLTAALDALLG